MSINDSALGGRLPLCAREALDPAQKELFDWLMIKASPWAEDTGFQVSTQAGQLIGPFNPALLTPGISSAFFDLALAEQKHTSLTKRSREVVILTVGAVWQAPYELYAHCAVGRDAGLSDDAVHTLADGGLPKDLSDDETVAHRVARALASEPKVLVVAPMAGHFSTLLRGTVRDLLPDCDVYVTEWNDARFVPHIIEG